MKGRRGDADGEAHRAGKGFAVLDIGDSTGALLLYAPSHMAGTEIEISRVGESTRRQHAVVHARHSPAGTTYAALYPKLAAGRYELWATARIVALTVAIDGGSVTEARWPSRISTAR